MTLPGKQLDALDRALAEKLMGWEKREYPGEPGQYAWCEKGVEDFWQAHRYAVYTPWKPDEDWSPTRNTSQSFQVADNLNEKGYTLLLEQLRSGAWEATFRPFKNELVQYGNHYAHDDEKELAISLAAAKALGIEVEDL